MSDTSSSHVIAVIVADRQRSRLGLSSRLDEPLGDGTVLSQTLRRLSQVRGIETIVVVHPEGQDFADINDIHGFAGPTMEGATHSESSSRACLLPKERPTHARLASLAVRGTPSDNSASNSHHAMRTSSRRWALHAWRGGLGGAACYDELLPAEPILEAMRKHDATAALIVGADWSLVDPQFCTRLVEMHVAHAEAMQFVFCQAPPGLAGAVVGREVLENIAKNPGSTMGQILAYVPSRPQPDPIGRDACLQIDGAVRSCARRFIADTPRSIALMREVVTRLGVAASSADAATIVRIVAAIEADPTYHTPFTPQQVTLELTPRRVVTGSITPQHYVQLDRPELSLDRAIHLVQQFAPAQDVVLTLGGLGDALLHPQWDRIVEAAHAAGIMGICIETDLLVDRATIDRLLELPIDVVSIRLNADRAATYQEVMGADRFAQVMDNLQYLFQRRSQRWQSNVTPAGVPWLVTRMVKTTQTLQDMETFYDKWVHCLGHAVIEPATTGCGLMPELSPVNMAPPRRRACRQVGQRMTVLSDATVARCDQDWLGRGKAGDASNDDLETIGAALAHVQQAHRDSRWDELELCGSCSEWHRP